MMDQHDLKASGMADGFRHFCSPEQPYHIGKAQSLSDSYRVLDDGDIGLDKHKHGSISDPEISSCESTQSTEIENKCLNHDRISSIYCTKESDDESTLLSSAVSPSRSLELKKENCAEGTCKIVLGNGNRNDESASSSTGIGSAQNISIKSDVSSEGKQTLGKETNESTGGRMNQYWLDIKEHGLKLVTIATCNSKQLKIESSSNSVQAILPASSNESCQGTSMDAKSCDHSKQSGIATSTCTDLNCCLDKPIVNNSQLGKASQIAIGFSLGKQGHRCNPSKIVGNVGTRDCDKLVKMTADGNLVMLKRSDLQKSISPKKEDAEFVKVKYCCELNDALAVVQRVARDVEQEVGMYKEASGSCSSIQDKSGETVHLSSVDSTVSNKGCLTETRSKIQFGNKRDRFDSFASMKDEIKELCLEVKEPSQYRDHMKKHKANDGLHEQGSSPLTIKSEDITANDQPNYVSGIDLNENIFANEMDYHRQSKEVISFRAEILSKPIPLVAQSGLPICLPKPHMQFDGDTGGWRGSAATSAFHSTSFSDSLNRIKASFPVDSNNRSKSSQVTGIDLNIVAEGGDCDMEFLPEKCFQPVSSFPSKRHSIKINSSQVEKFNIDLNCSSENDENCHQPFSPSTLSRNSVKDFDLNDNPTSADAYNDSHLPAQGTPAPRDGVFGDCVFTFLGNAKHPESNNVGSPYQPDLSPIQSFSHGQAKPFLMASPAILPSIEQMRHVVSLQQRPTYASYPPPPSLPPHTLLCDNAFFIDPSNCLSSNVYPPGAISYNITNSAATAFFPHISGSNAPSTFFGTPYLMRGPGGPNSNDIATIRPSFDPNGGISSSESRNWGENGRQLSVPVNNGREDHQIRSLHQLALSAAPVKREPDGGWGSHQLGLREMTSWR